MNCVECISLKWRVVITNWMRYYQIVEVCHMPWGCVTISSDLSWNAHVDEIISKARKRVYMIYQLKRAGINQNDLIRIYVSVIRPVVEYACPVWHTNLPKYLSDNIEIIQKRCLKLYFHVTNTKISCIWSTCRHCTADAMNCVECISLKWRLMTTNWMRYYQMVEVCHMPWGCVTSCQYQGQKLIATTIP